MATIADQINQAVRLHQSGNLAQAEALYRQILQADPRHAPALHLLGSLAHQTGHHDAAVALIGQAIAINPLASIFHFNLGLVHKKLRHWTEAAACFQQALQINPQHVDASIYLGQVFIEQGQLAEAIECHRQALYINPNHSGLHVNMGNAYVAKGLLDEAEECFRQALAVDRYHAGAHLNLGNTLLDQGRLDKALASYQNALAANPSLHDAHSNLVYTLHFCPDLEPADLLKEHRRWNQLYAQPLAKFLQPHDNDKAPERRLRIGYLSPELRAHPVGRFLLPLLQNHDQANFEIFCYSAVQVPDQVTDHCRAHADVWRDCQAASDEQIAGMIRQDRIDILVDLTMHMAGRRLLVFARKPAPIQVCYLAYCGTTGLDTMDYRFTDPYLDPPAHERFYTEKSIHLPETYWCYHPLVKTPEVATPPALVAGQVTFGCLNNFCKVTSPTLESWALLLSQVPNSRLILFAGAGRHRERVRGVFANHDVAAERIQFMSGVPLAEYFRFYGDIDIALDPFPYGGGTTTCDALWMGVPVVSLAGAAAVGRGGLSILSNIGLPELVASSIEEYIRIAVKLARDLPRLAEVRAGLRERMLQSPLMNAPRFARNVEAAYRAMWRAWCAV
jgi:protein O-GlcNAc transferase